MPTATATISLDGVKKSYTTAATTNLIGITIWRPILGVSKTKKNLQCFVYGGHREYATLANGDAGKNV